MNVFRFAGDMTHLISVLVLLLKIYATKSCSGISLKTEELYALVFLARYLDLFTDFISVYNTVMKIVFIMSSLAIVWCMRMHPMVRRSYDKELDTFRHYFLIAGCLLGALLVHEKFTFQEIFWAFSLYLEAVAILPQLVLLQRSGNVDNLTGQYVFFLGIRWHNLYLELIANVIYLKFLLKSLSCTVYPELDLSLFHREAFRTMDILHLGSCPDSSLWRLLLLLLYKVKYSRVDVNSNIVHQIWSQMSNNIILLSCSWKNNAKLQLPA
ncbi:hypothetical protein C5167_008613 [Papaver somniferum]|uniref:ER lumen protein-retaining receptor n=1 Tax=Papaver somniferum TaxID=3469 RepID=A0A4Y7JV30_PAPSO|nr:hypothetical protein C5167_008613 [Papaver somniferum]